MKKNQILTLKEASDLLDISSETVLNLVSQKDIGAIKVGNQWRFTYEDIEKWKSVQKRENVEQIAIKNVTNRFMTFMDESLIMSDIIFKNRFDVLAQMSHFAKKQKVCTKNRWLFEMLCSREDLISTAVGNGIAFLHPRKIDAEKIKRPAILLGISKEGIEFRSLDKTPVNLFFLILMQSERDHLFALSYLSQLFRNESLREKIISIESKKKIFEILKIKL